MKWGLAAFLVCAPAAAESGDSVGEVALVTSTATEAPSCEMLTFISAAAFAQFAEEMPNLAYVLTELLVDPRLPIKYRNLIKTTLESPDTQVRNLTAERRQEWVIHRHLRAFLNSQNRGFAQFRYTSETSVTTNESSGRDQKLPERSPHFIAVPDRDFSDLMDLIHESAHVKFSEFMAANIAKIGLKMGKNQFDEHEGTPRIHAELFHFLTERYAHEMQYRFAEVLESMDLISDREEIWQNFTLKKGREANKISAISASIIQRYNIKNPQVLLLRNESLARILNGGNKDYARYDRWATPNVKDRFGGTAPFYEQEIVGLLIDSGTDVTEVERNERIFARLILLAENPHWFLGQFLASMIEVYVGDRAFLTRLQAAFVSPQILRCLNDRQKLKLSENFTLNELYGNIVRFDRLYVYQEYCHFRYHLMKRAYGISLPAAKDADLDPTVIRKQFDELFDLNYTSVQFIKDEELVKIKLARDDYPALVAFWSEMSLGDVFQHFYADAPSFWSSNESMNGIFETLTALKAEMAHPQTSAK